MRFSRARVVGLLAGSSVLAVLLAVAGCGKGGGAGGGTTARGQIPIGVYGSLTGTTATFGQSTETGVQMAVDEAHRGGGIGGEKITATVEDDRADAAEAATG